MRLAHLSELHLGFRAYERTERGRNVRERDVATAFERAVQELGRLRPDLIVIAGDVFDRADPAPSALLALTRGLDALRSDLHDTAVVFAAGARDTPLRPGDAVALSVLESLPGVEVATGTVRALRIEPDLHVCLVPYRAGLREPYPAPTPDPRARWNVLVGYGDVGEGGVGVPVDPGAWSYVALGGSHTHRIVGRNVVYAGALERVGPSPWDEAAEEKGFVTVDLASGRTRFHSLPVRPVVALAPVRTPPAGPPGLPERVREVTREVPGGIEDKIVRLRVQAARPRDLLVLQGELLADLSRRALHLDVEAEEVGSPSPLPRAADVVERRLDEAGASRSEVESLLSPEEEPAGVGSLRVRVTADDPVLGEVDLLLPEGVVAVVSGDPSATHRLIELLGGADEGDPPPWLDSRPVAPSDLADALEAVLARLLGVAPLEAALAEEDAGTKGASGVEDLVDVERLLAELEGAEGELRRLEEELREARADHAEVAGDLEVETMAWLRERQDAETHLQAYRDRARELKVQLAEIESVGPDAPCPTCGRLLRDHYDAVLAELREEWESVVQDGRWWKRRREQLELKPEALQDLEGRALRLQAAVEACAERVEGARSRVRERDELRERAAELGARDGSPGLAPGAEAKAEEGKSATVDLLRASVREVRSGVRDRLFERASRYVCLVTGSRALALTDDDSTVRVEGVETVLPSADEESAAAEVSLRLAGAAMAVEGGAAVEGALLPTALLERLREGDRLRLLDVLPALRAGVPRVVLGMHTASAERRHESLGGVLELRPEGEEGPPFRWLPSGPSRIVLAGQGD